VHVTNTSTILKYVKRLLAKGAILARKKTSRRHIRRKKWIIMVLDWGHVQ